MAKIDFKNKYLKYKNKYLTLKGGLINQIDRSELSRQKEDYTVPHKLKEYISLINYLKWIYLDRQVRIMMPSWILSPKIIKNLHSLIKMDRCKKLCMIPKLKAKNFRLLTKN